MAKLDLSALEARFARVSTDSRNTPQAPVQHIAAEPPDPQDIDIAVDLLSIGASRKALETALEEIANALYGRARRHDAFKRIAGVPFPGDPNTDLADRLLRALPFAQEPAKNPPVPARPTVVNAETLVAYGDKVTAWESTCPNQIGARRRAAAEQTWMQEQVIWLRQEADAAIGRRLAHPDSRVLAQEELAYLQAHDDLCLRWWRVRPDVPCSVYGRWDKLTDTEFFLPGRNVQDHGYRESFAQRVPLGTVRNGLLGGLGIATDLPDGVYSIVPSNEGWIHNGSTLFGQRLAAGWQPPGTYARLAGESEQRERAAETLRRQSAATAARDADKTRGQTAYLCFTLAAGSATAGIQPQMVSISGGDVMIPAVTVGEKGRGRELGLLPVGGLAEAVITGASGQLVRSVPLFNAAVVGKTASGKTKLFAAAGPVDTSKAIVVLRTAMGYRGGNGHTGDVTGREAYDDYGTQRERFTFGPFPGDIICSGTIAEGDAGRMGSGTQMVAIVPRGVVFRAYRTGRLYGAPASHYYVFDGAAVRVATWDERCAADLWEDLGCAPIGA